MMSEGSASLLDGVMVDDDAFCDARPATARSSQIPVKYRRRAGSWAAALFVRIAVPR